MPISVARWTATAKQPRIHVSKIVLCLKESISKKYDAWRIKAIEQKLDFDNLEDLHGFGFEEPKKCCDVSQCICVCIDFHAVLFL